MRDLHPPEQELRAAYTFIQNSPFPSIPDVVNKIAEEFSRPEPDLSRLIGLINSDIALAGLVLKSINSAGYGYENIESVQQAVVLLGLNKVKNLVMASYVRHYLPTRSTFAKRIWEDSTEVANLAVRIAAELFDVPLDEAYIAGLMLDCGAIFVAERMLEKYDAVFQMRHERPMSINRIEDYRIGINHSAIGYLFARHWRLPERVCLAIYLHHGTSCEKIDDAPLRSLLAVVKLADYLVMKVHTGIELDHSMEQIQHIARLKGELMIDSNELVRLEQMMN